MVENSVGPHLALERERDDLLRSLEDLEREFRAGDISESDYRELRAEYMRRTGVVLDHISRESQDIGGERARHRAGSRLRRRLGSSRAKRVLIVALAFWLIAGVAVAALHFAGVRLPGESATGSLTLSEALVVEQRLAQASTLAGMGQIAEAIAVYGQILVTVPDQRDALTYQGWLIRLSGISARSHAVVASGDAELAKAVRVAPGYADARGLDGVALAEDAHDVPGAIVEIRAMAKDHPSPTLVRALSVDVRKIYAAAKMAPPAMFTSEPTS